MLRQSGWVDLDLRSSPAGGPLVGHYCPSKMVEHPKSKPTTLEFRLHGQRFLPAKSAHISRKTLTM